MDLPVRTLALLVSSAALVLAAPGDWLCQPTVYMGCYNDSAPATRPVNNLTQASSQWLSLGSCASQCAAYGFAPYLAVTGQPGSAECYCGNTISPGAHRVSDARCSLRCPSNASQACGANGYSSLWQFACSGPVPPLPPNDPPLAPGRACSQPESQTWLWCNASAPLEARVADLAGRFTLTEIGPQLTARQAPRVDRLGTNAFYWGTNALHGIETGACAPAGGNSSRCATSWPQVGGRRSLEGEGDSVVVAAGGVVAARAVRQRKRVGNPVG